MKKCVILLLTLWHFTLINAQEPLAVSAFSEQPFSAFSLAYEHESSEAIEIAFIQTKEGIVNYFSIGRDGELGPNKILNIPDAQIYKGVSVGNSIYLAGCQKIKRKSYPTIWKVNVKDGTYNANRPMSDNFTGYFSDIEFYDRRFRLCGQVNEKMCFLFLNAQLNLNANAYLAGTKKSSAAKALAIDEYGKTYVAGYEVVKQKMEPVIWKFDKYGNHIWDRSYPINGMASGVDVVILDVWDIAVAIEDKGSGFEEDLVLLKIASNGEPLLKTQLKTPEKREFPRFILQNEDGNLLVGGFKILFGHRSGAYWHQLYDKSLTPIEGDYNFPAELNENSIMLLPLPSRNFLSIEKDKKVVKVNFHKEEQQLCETQLEPAVAMQFDPKSKKEVVLEGESYTFKGDVLAKSPLEEWDIDLIVKEVGMRGEGQEIDRVSLEPVSTLEGQYCYELEYTMTLPPGYSDIFTTIYAQENTLIDTFRVNNRPIRPNLFILSVGIASNLKYTSDDAEDFAEIFNNQSERLFETVHTQVITGREDTKGWKLKGYLDNLKDNPEINIKPEDVFILFISSHGIIQNDTFFLQASDYQEGDNTGLIAFNEDVLGALNELECKKVLFVDACKSGLIDGRKGGEGKKEALGAALNQLLAQSPGVVAKISSSSDNQLSYELDSLQNGIFTYALQEAFQEERIHEVDKNKNAIITLGELFQFLQEEVVVIGKSYNNGKPQTPYFHLPKEQSLYTKQEAFDFPLYYNSNYK